jgi:hypothetical protein
MYLFQADRRRFGRYDANFARTVELLKNCYWTFFFLTVFGVGVAEVGQNDECNHTTLFFGYNYAQPGLLSPGREIEIILTLMNFPFLYSRLQYYPEA